MARGRGTSLKVPIRGRHKGTGMKKGRKGVNPKAPRMKNRGGGR